ncbi:hypothetical protein [Methanoculleus frigidifontis]|uniref:hypothetical protein n=1 Tax=Methanoculleus frigidifontis TaxID=2584085 RepID=UPI00265870CE|nr:hypothetical protein [Methanoculleus sp. FWC-SCC1]
MDPEQSDPDILEEEGNNGIEIPDHGVPCARSRFHLISHPVGRFDREPGAIGLMDAERMPRKATGDVAQIFNPMVSSFTLSVLHGNGDGQDRRWFTSHPILSVPGLRPLEQFFHPFTVFPDRNDEGYLHPGQKPDNFPGVELPIKAESFDSEAEFGNPVKAAGVTGGIKMLNSDGIIVLTSSA